jgi:hypothetical protein
VCNRTTFSADFSLWADSFHEGEWACRQIGQRFETLGGTFTVEYLEGFVPYFKYSFLNHELAVTVYGNYSSWDPKPAALSKLLEWGRPDLVLINNFDEQILLAVEETAATPTGNQGLQRCERQFGAAMEGFPFWYLIAEFGIHSDGGIRRDSVWPALMGLEIMTSLEIPSVVLHYSDLDNPEDYSSGSGMASLFKVMAQVLLNVSEKQNVLFGLESEITEQITAITKFVEDTFKNSLYFLPSMKSLKAKELAYKLCQPGDKRQQKNVDRKTFLKWPLTSELSPAQSDEQIGRPLKKNDPFASLLEQAIEKKIAYGISKGSGSKPLNKEKMQDWIRQQNSKQKQWERTVGESQFKNSFRMKLSDFPPSPTGFHVITAPRILYLFDDFTDVVDLLEVAFPRLVGAGLTSDHSPALVYISNSVKPGRIFGDPYTGQISAYATSFGSLSKGRKVIAYFPHQSVAQAAENIAKPNNKGLRIMTELTDLLVFGGGITLNTKSQKIL